MAMKARMPGGPRSTITSLQVKVRAWPTPMAMDSEQSGSASLKDPTLNRMAVTWPSPSSRDDKGVDIPGRHGGASLSHATQTSQFSHRAPLTANGPLSSTSSPTSPRRLNPAFVCWLMGWPWWWTQTEPMPFASREMEWFHSKLQAQLYCFFNGQG